MKQPCLNCHQLFNVPPIHKETAKFCTLACRIAFKSIGMSPKRKEQSRQKRLNELARRHPCAKCGQPCYQTAVHCKKCAPHKYNFKGGRFKKEGYAYLWMPQHPRANRVGYVQEHLYNWEEANGKRLPPGWVIHHLNGIKDDNRPRNLIALPNRKHYLVLQVKAKRIQELESLLNGQGH